MVIDRGLAVQACSAMHALPWRLRGVPDSVSSHCITMLQNPASMECLATLLSFNNCVHDMHM